MKSLSGLIGAYDLDAGDVINVASGTYRAYRNTVLTAQDSGVTIRGSVVNSPTINRGTALSERRVIDLVNADGVTLENLRLTGGEIGVYASNGADSDDLVASILTIFGNSYAGVYVGGSNDRWRISDGKLFGVPGGTDDDNQSYGVFFDYNSVGMGHQLIGNEIYDLWLRASGGDIFIFYAKD